MKKIIFLLAIVLVSCSKDPAIVPDYMDPVRFPVEIQPILKRFLKEGNDRGVFCDINNLRKIEFKENLSVDGVKSAGYYSHSNNTIYLDSTSFSYKMSEDSKERTLYHELGHGILKREHKDDMLSDNTAVSIMNSSNGISYVTMPYMTLSLHYRRGYYIDELFHPETPAPSWAF
jgi:hypothetical protein